jgi:cytochrome c-type biogenesis protein
MSFLSPCVLPLVPSYLSFVTGMSLEDLEKGVDRRATFIHSLLFVVGFSIIILGLHLTGVFKIAPLMRERRIHVNDRPAGYLGTIGVGAAFGAGWTPCIGPVLGAILTLAGTQDSVWAGVTLLSVYSMGLAIPFLISALALSWFLGVFSRFRRFIPMIEKASGVLLILVGVLLMTGTFTLLSTWLLPFTPDWILERT